MQNYQEESMFRFTLPLIFLALTFINCGKVGEMSQADSSLFVLPANLDSL
jgi:hypothetical protein